MFIFRNASVLQCDVNQHCQDNDGGVNECAAMFIARNPNVLQCDVNQRCQDNDAGVNEH